MNADNVRFIREVFDLSQRDLANALNVTPATAARWEASGSAGHFPKGLQSEVLQALHNVALRVENDDAEKLMIRGLIVLGIGALIFYLLTRE